MQAPKLPPPLPRMGLLMSHPDSHQQPRSFMAVERRQIKEAGGGATLK